MDTQLNIPVYYHKLVKTGILDKFLNDPNDVFCRRQVFRLFRIPSVVKVNNIVELLKLVKSKSNEADKKRITVSKNNHLNYRNKCRLRSNQMVLFNKSDEINTMDFTSLIKANTQWYDTVYTTTALDKNITKIVEPRLVQRLVNNILTFIQTINFDELKNALQGYHDMDVEDDMSVYDMLEEMDMDDLEHYMSKESILQYDQDEVAMEVSEVSTGSPTNPLDTVHNTKALIRSALQIDEAWFEGEMVERHNNMAGNRTVYQANTIPLLDKISTEGSERNRTIESAYVNLEHLLNNKNITMKNGNKESIIDLVTKEIKEKNKKQKSKDLDNMFPLIRVFKILMDRHMYCFYDGNITSDIDAIKYGLQGIVGRAKRGDVHDDPQINHIINKFQEEENI